MLYWDFLNEGAARAGAIPEELTLPYGERGTRRKASFAERWREIERGVEVRPGDCPAIRLIARYGILVSGL